MRKQRSIHPTRAALLAIVTVLVVFFGFTFLAITTAQRSQLYEHAKQASDAQVALVADFLREPLLSHQYRNVEIFLEQWASQAQYLARFDASAANGFRIAEYDRAGELLYPYSTRFKVEHDGRTLMTMDAIFDFREIEASLRQSTVLVAILSIIVGAALVWLLWVVVRASALRPMERAERSAIESAKLAQALRDANPDLILHLAHDGTVLGFDARSQSDSHAPPDEFLRKKLQDILPSDVGSQFDSAIAALGRGTALEQIEYQLRINGNDRAYEARLAPMSKGQIMAIVRDVTELQRSREALQRAERLGALSTLSAGMAHEINNPLGSILAAAQFAEKIREDPNSDEQIQGILKTIGDQTRRCAHIVRNILRFSREQSAEKSACDLNEVIARARDHLAGLSGGFGVHFSFDPAPGLPMILVNPAEIEQVIANLVRNAAESGGLGVEVLVRTQLHDDRVRLQVIDSGPGMAPEVSEHIFEPFFTTRQTEGGTGLGLSLVHGILRNHQATIRVDSATGAGTAFTIDFPIHTGDEVESMPAAAPSEG